MAEFGRHRGEGLGHTRALGRARGGQGGLGARGGGGLASGSCQIHHLRHRLLGGTGPGPGPGGRQLLLRLELSGLLHGDALGLALGRRGVGRLGHGGQGRAGAGTGCAKINSMLRKYLVKIFVSDLPRCRSAARPARTAPAWRPGRTSGSGHRP